MSVSITQLRRQLKHWLELTGIGPKAVIARLVREGMLTLPAQPRRTRAKDLPKLKVVGEGRQISDYLDDVR